MSIRLASSAKAERSVTAAAASGVPVGASQGTLDLRLRNLGAAGTALGERAATTRPPAIPPVYLPDYTRYGAPIIKPRWGIDHQVTVGGVDISRFVKGIRISEGIDKATEATLDVDNTEFELGEWSVMKAGSVVVIRLYDGLVWRGFGEMLVTEPERTYEASGSISLRCLSREITLQFNEKAVRWTKKKHTEIVREIAKANNLSAEVEELDSVYVPTEVTKANEPISTFLNRLATRDGYEWGVDGSTLFYRKPGGKEAGITLSYRPPNGALGTILSATGSVEASKKGKNRKVAVSSIDVDSGTVDDETMDAMAEGASAAEAETIVDETDTADSDSTQAALNTPAGATNPGPAKQAKKEATIKRVGGKFEAIPDAEVRHTETARTAEEAAALKKNAQRTNAYDKRLRIETYGMADIRPRLIVNVIGLNTPDNGKWLLVEVEHQFSAKSAWRMTLNTRSHSKEDPKGAAKAPAAAANTPKDEAALTKEVPPPTVRREGGRFVAPPVTVGP